MVDLELMGKNARKAARMMATISVWTKKCFRKRSFQSIACTSK